MASRRQLARYRQVANALARHGFGYLVEEAGLADLIHWRYRGQTGPELVHGRGQRVRRLLEELGPTFVKLGQLLSTRPDLIPPDILAEIARLQDQVPPFPFDLVRAVIEEELKATLDRVFAAFEPKPLAAASIGQVHRARLRQGPEVVVKVQRPGIRELVDADLAILADLARLVDARSRLGKVYRFRELVAEFQRTLYAEMDFTGEARTAQAFRRNFQGDPTVVIPQVYLQFTTRRVLTLEYIGGVNLNRYMQAPTPPQERRRVAETIVRAMLRQFLEHGLFHADPHPGNILVQGPDRVAFLDFGMVGRLSDATREQFVGLVISLIRGDSDGIVAALLSLGLVPAGVDVAALRRDVATVRERYYEVPLHELSLTDAVETLFDIVFRHHIRIPTDLTLLGKALVTVEGVASQLSPDLSVVEMAEPFGRQLLRERLHPLHLARRGRERLVQAVLEAASLPEDLRTALLFLRSGRVPLALDAAQWDELARLLEEGTRRLTRALHRVALAILITGAALVWAILHIGR